MTIKIKLDDLEALKLVDTANCAPLYEVTAALDHAFTQGSQSWGVTREVGVYLSLARDLSEALEISETAEQNHRMLKGAQMETGRLKKKIASLEQHQTKLSAENMALEYSLKEAQQQIRQLQKDLDASE